jgi:putative protein kinase ArgK-like GTPase of G3E family
MEAQRASQRRSWMWRQLQDEILAQVQMVNGLENRVRELERKLSSNLITPRIAAERLLNAYLASAKMSAQMEEKPSESNLPIKPC